METSLSTQQLTELLQTAAELEAAIYTLDRTIPKASGQIQAQRPEAPSAAGKKPVPPREPQADAPPKMPQKSRYKGATAVIAVVFIAAFLVMAASGDLLAALGDLVFAVAFCYAVHVIKEQEREKAEAYQRDLAAYEEEQRAYSQEWERYERAMADWEAGIEDAKHQSEMSQALEAYQTALAAHTARGQELLDSLNALAEESVNRLDALYALGWLRSEYQSFPAVTTICEYLQSGRCTELEGDDGAYSLYDAELQQNIIKDDLEAIERGPAQILQDQYLLYTAMEKSSRMTGEIVQDISAVLRRTEAAAWNAGCAAYFAEITARNEEAARLIASLGGAAQ